MQKLDKFHETHQWVAPLVGILIALVVGIWGISVVGLS